MDQYAARRSNRFEPVTHRLSPRRTADHRFTADERLLAGRDDRHHAIDRGMRSKGPPRMRDLGRPAEQLKLLGHVAARPRALSGGDDQRDNLAL